MSDDQYNIHIEDVPFERDLGELIHEMTVVKNEESVVGKDPAFNIKGCESERVSLRQ